MPWRQVFRGCLATDAMTAVGLEADVLGVDVIDVHDRAEPGELVPARSGEQLARARLDLLWGDSGGVQLALQVLPVQGVCLGMGGYSCFSVV